VSIGVAGLAVAGDGSMYVLVGGYYAPEYRFYKTNVSSPAWNSRVAGFNSEQIFLDESAGILWGASYTSDLTAYDAGDLSVKTTFTDEELGGHVYSMAAFGDDESLPPPPKETDDSSSGCEAGFGALPLLLLAVVAVLKQCKK
jgi:hypothetical protein